MLVGRTLRQFRGALSARAARAALPAISTGRTAADASSGASSGRGAAASAASFSIGYLGATWTLGGVNINISQGLQSLQDFHAAAPASAPAAASAPPSASFLGDGANLNICQGQQGRQGRQGRQLGRQNRRSFQSCQSCQSFHAAAPASAPAAASAPPPSASFLGECLANYSIEVTPGAARKIASFADIALLAPGTVVNVTYLVGADMDESLAICARLVEGGMRPVAHVPARAFATMADAEEYLSRLSALGVEDVLVLGGGAPQPAGKLHETMQILESGLLQRYGFRTVGVAAHPEGPPDIGEDELLDALLRKAAWARDHGVDMYYETQFCFDPEPIVAWEKRTRAALKAHLDETPVAELEDGAGGGGVSGGAGVVSPHAAGWLPAVRLGVAGPAKISSLIKFGTMSGVGNSLSFVSKYAGNVFKLATKMGPEELILGVGEHQRKDPECMIEGFHFYPFGGFNATLTWIHEQ
jgi:methylenetetrahydrofolate reductase (NADPH)